jgi:putative ABC transport system permease protein
MTIVGVVGRIKQDALDADSRIAMYLAHTQFPTRSMNVVLETAADPSSLAAPAMAEIRRMDPDLPVYNVRTMAQRVNESLARRRFAMLLMTLFAGLGLGLATVGVYGVIAYLVSQGTREIGIRIAVGATPHGILMLIVRHGMMLAVLGVSIGLAGAITVTRFMRRLLFQVDALDPATFAAVALLLTLIALAASVVPARRAARTDPIQSLRSE